MENNLEESQVSQPVILAAGNEPANSKQTFETEDTREEPLFEEEETEGDEDAELTEDELEESSDELEETDEAEEA